jgi:hypothetical protein
MQTETQTAAAWTYIPISKVGKNEVRASGLESRTQPYAADPSTMPGLA